MHRGVLHQAVEWLRGRCERYGSWMSQASTPLRQVEGSRDGADALREICEWRLENRRALTEAMRTYDASKRVSMNVQGVHFYLTPPLHRNKIGPPK
jgi:hypothetical protein